jgi:DNA-binding transcriptional ArsR family regulator
MLRIFFDTEDLGRIRLAPGPDPMWEIALSLHRLRRHDAAVIFDGWRQQVRGSVPATTRMLADLIPPGTGYFADFLTPMTSAPTLASSLDGLRSTTRARLHRDLSVIAARQKTRPVPLWMSRLADGDVPTLERLARVTEQYFDACLGSHWQHIRARIDQERFRLARLLAEFGSERVLQDLHPSGRWSSGMLEFAYPLEHELHLDGRGLVLLPSFFCWGAPTTLRDGDLTPVLVYPIQHDLGWTNRRPHSVVALLGRSRTTVLEAVAGSACTTSELARQAAMPLATVSQQATVLREAGLILSRRTGQAVVHSITPLGLAVLARGG